MKTTLDMPDALYRRIKSHAASRGLSVRQFVTDTLAEKISKSARATNGEPPWMKVFGKAPRGAAREINRIVEREFGQVDPADWK